MIPIFQILPRRLRLPWLDLPDERPFAPQERLKELMGGELFDWDLARAELGILQRLGKELNAAHKAVFQHPSQDVYQPVARPAEPTDDVADLADLESFRRAVARDIEARLAVPTDQREKALKATKEAQLAALAEAARMAAALWKAEATQRRERAAAAASASSPPAASAARPVSAAAAGSAIAGNRTASASAQRPAANRPATAAEARAPEPQPQAGTSVAAREEAAARAERQAERLRSMNQALRGSAPPGALEVRRRNLVGGSTRRGVDPFPEGAPEGDAARDLSQGRERPVVAFGRRVDRPLPLPPRYAIWNTVPVKARLPRVAALQSRVQRKEVLRITGRPAAPPNAQARRLPVFSMTEEEEEEEEQAPALGTAYVARAAAPPRPAAANRRDVRPSPSLAPTLVTPRLARRTGGPRAAPAPAEQARRADNGQARKNLLQGMLRLLLGAAADRLFQEAVRNMAVNHMFVFVSHNI